MNRKIIFINRFYWPDESATAQLLTDLAEFLSAEEFEVTVVTGRRGYIRGNEKYRRTEKRNGVNILRLSSSGSGRYNLWLRLWDYFLFFGGLIRTLRKVCSKDAVIVTLSDPPLVHSWVRLFFRNLNTVHWSMDEFPEIVSETTQKSWKRALLRPFQIVRDRSLDTNQSVVCLSEEMAGFFGDKSCVPTVIYNWSPVECMTAPDREIEELRSQWTVSIDDCLVGYSGNLGHVHDAATARLGIEYALQEEIAAKFILIGGGKRFAEFDDLSESRLESVKLVDFSPRGKTAESLSAVDIHWFSLYPQFSDLVFPSKFAGICSVGRPSIFVGDVESALAKLISEHSLGLVVQSGDSRAFCDALNRLVSDKELRLQLGVNAHKFYAQHFSKQVGLELWKQLLSAQFS